MSEQDIEILEKERKVKGMNKKKKMYERGEREKEKMSIREIGRQRADKRERELNEKKGLK